MHWGCVYAVCDKGVLSVVTQLTADDAAIHLTKASAQIVAKSSRLELESLEVWSVLQSPHTVQSRRMASLNQWTSMFCSITLNIFPLFQDLACLDNKWCQSSNQPMTASFILIVFAVELSCSDSRMFSDNRALHNADMLLPFRALCGDNDHCLQKFCHRWLDAA